MITKILILYVLFFCYSTTSRKLRSPVLDSLKTDSLNECGRCKVLTNSFNHWLEKTSRGKYEGGDTAWEEAKLKSYSRSEIRLVEVQEGLCSELSTHQDDCYVLAEEAEQALEKWWFNEDPSASDLHTWLCIETLKNCCPMNHFGEFCTPCPLDKNNKICSGLGKCDGEGTRTGNGSCICKRGYRGEYCQDCAENFYRANDLCLSCHKSCEGCDNEGATSCHSCKSGWKLESGVCVDVNECVTENICTQNQYCINKEGSYKCKSCDSLCLTCKGSGSGNCTSCPPGGVLWGGTCITNKQKSEILTSTIQRLWLYLGLLVIALFILRFSKTLASLTVVIIAIYVYYSEKSRNTNIFDVIKNTFGINF